MQSPRTGLRADLADKQQHCPATGLCHLEAAKGLEELSVWKIGFCKRAEGVLTLLSRALAPPSDKQLPLSLRDRKKAAPRAPCRAPHGDVTPGIWCSPKGAFLAPGTGGDTASPCSEASLQAPRTVGVGAAGS